KATGHSNASWRRRNSVQLRGRRHDGGVDLPASLDRGVGHRDPIDSLPQDPVVGADSTEHSRIETIAFSTSNRDVMQRRTKQLEGRFLRFRSVVPQQLLLKEFRGDTSEGWRLEAKQRRTLLARMADETDFGCGSQGSRHAAARSARMKKPHAYGV